MMKIDDSEREKKRKSAMNGNRVNKEVGGAGKSGFFFCLKRVNYDILKCIFRITMTGVSKKFRNTTTWYTLH